MKKLYCIAVLLGLANVAMGQGLTMTAKAYSFINNGTYLCITNNSTYTDYNKDTGTNLWYLSYPIGTNVLSGTTNSNGQLLAPAVVDANVFPNLNGDANPNIAIQVVMNVYSNFPSSSTMTPQVQNTIWTNPIATFPFDVDSSNAVTFIFMPVGPDGYADTAASAKTFSFTASPTNNLPYTLTTNVPSSFLVGVSRIRLVSIGASNVSGSPGSSIAAIKLLGWSP